MTLEDRRTTQGRKTIPGPRGLEKWKGLLEIAKRPQEYIPHLARTYGEIVCLNFLRECVVFLFNPEHIEYVLHRNYTNYVKRTPRWTAFRQVLHQGLIVSDGDHWRVQRQRLQPAFHAERARRFGELVVEAMHEKIEEWDAAAQQERPFDLLNDMFLLNLRTLTRALFTDDLGDRIGVVVNAMATAHRYINPMSLHNLLNPPRVLRRWVVPGYREFEDAFAVLSNTTDEIIARRRKSDRDPGDLLSMIMQGRDEETDAQMNDDEVRDEVLTVLVTGHETVSIALSWTGYWLTRYPEVARTLRAELDAVLGGRIPQFDDLPKLAFTRMVLLESMRLSPPVWGFDRLAVNEDHVDGYRIPRKATVALSAYTMHRHPLYWPDPEVFDPLRFTPEREKQRPDYAYFPFGGGARRCIGNRFAMAQLQLQLAMLAQRYEFDLMPEFAVEPQFILHLRPRWGVWLRFRRRNELPLAARA